jgi:hypothetical protein
MFHLIMLILFLLEKKYDILRLLLHQLNYLILLHLQPLLLNNLR